MIGTRDMRRCRTAPVSPYWRGCVARMIHRSSRKRQRGIVCGVAALAIMTTVGRAGDDGAVVIGGCRLATVGTGVVSAVIDARTVMLDGSREVRMAAIEVAVGPREEPARVALADAVLGQTVVLRGASPETDRYGRLVAHIFVGPAGTERWIQSDMVAHGSARVAARIGDRGCAAELLARERAARDAKLGLWAEPYYSIRRAEDPAAIVADRGRFAVVEGKVMSVRESGGTIYVNFGRRWSQDFAVTILKRNERSFAAAGLDPKRLDGRRVRVRGFIEERGGPWIEALRPEQIELLEGN
jgi:endonuclease YncB( thermonuclease family)